MTSPDHYRAEAQRCRDLAAASSDSESAKRWRVIAAEYDTLAEAMDAASVFQRAPVQRQPMQQQQQQGRKEPD